MSEHREDDRRPQPSPRGPADEPLSGVPPLDEDIPQIDFRIDPDELPELPAMTDPIQPHEPLPLDVPPAQAPPAPLPPGPGERLPPVKPSAAPPPIKARRTLEPAPPPAPPPAPGPAPGRAPEAPAPPAAGNAPRRPRPVAPLRPLSPEGPGYGGFSDATTTVFSPQMMDDDDAVIMPAPAPEQLASHLPYGRAQSAAVNRSLFLRRTMIPILLTMGVLLPALAALWFASDASSVVRATGLWLPITLIVLGAVFLLLAVVNMAQVRHLLAQAPQRRPAPLRRAPRPL